MNLRLTEAETEALRARAEAEGRSMQEVARQAIDEYVSDRPSRLRAAIERIRAEDAELLEPILRKVTALPPVMTVRPRSADGSPFTAVSSRHPVRPRPDQSPPRPATTDQRCSAVTTRILERSWP